MSVSVSSFQAHLLEVYDGQRPIRLVERKNQLFMMLKKNQDANGKLYPLPLDVDDQANSSNDYSETETNYQASTVDAFHLTLVESFARAEIGARVLKQSASNKQAFVSARNEIDKGVKRIVRNISRQLFGNIGGAIGQIESISGDTITLVNRTDAHNFQLKQILQLSATDGTSGSARSGTVTVSATDTNAGTITCTGNITAGVAAAAVGDYLFQKGDFGVAGAGLTSWLPSVKPTSGESFFGVDRSVSDKLYGAIIDGSGTSVEHALLDAAAELAFRDGSPSHVVMNPLKMNDLNKEVGSKRVYNTTVKSQNASIGYAGFQIDTAAGPVSVFADASCPLNKAFMLSMDDWGIYSAGQVPHVDDEDGNVLSRIAGQNAYEARIAGYWQLGCRNPGASAVITF